MASYIDGFAFPIKRSCIAEYKELAAEVAELWLEHGALSYQEFIGDDLSLQGTRSFTDAVAATDEETIVFGWVEFASREARDSANHKVANDPRMAALVDGSDAEFDASRMAYGGFKPFISSSKPNR